MTFIVRAPSGGGSYFNDELGFGLDDGQELDLLAGNAFFSEVLAASATLNADLIANSVQRLDAFGGSVIPAAFAFDDQSVGNHQADISAHGLAIATLQQVTDAGSGAIIGTAERSKLNGIQAGAQVNDTGAQIVVKLQGEAQPIGIDVDEVGGATAAQLRDRTTHTGTQLASTISDFSSAADARIAAQKAAVLGIASLDGAGQVPFSQLGNLPPTFTPKGNWNASTNTPALVSSVGTVGDMYLVNVAGTTNLDGITDWQVGDQAYFASGAWQKSDNTDAVTSVAGKVGAVLLDTDDVSEAANLYYTESRVDSNASVVANTAKISASGPVSTHSDVNTAGATQGQALLLNGGIWEPGDLAGESAQPVVQTRLSSPFSLVGGVWSPIPFDASDEETDAASLSNPAGNLDRIVVLDDTAPVELVAFIPWDATTSDSMSIRIRKNDSGVVPGSEATIDDFSPICVVVKVPRSFITVGDYFRVEMMGDVDVLAGATFQATQLKGVKGEKGDPGAGSTVAMQDDGVAVATASTLNFERSLQAVDAGSGVVTVRVVEDYVCRGKLVNQDFSGSTPCLFGASLRSSSDFSVSTSGGGTIITCLFDGVVEASYDMSIDDVDNGRESSRCVLQKNGADVAHTSRYGYKNDDGVDSQTLSPIPITVVNGDILRVQMNVNTPPATLRALANGCLFKVKRIS